MRNLIVIAPAALGLALSACAAGPTADRYGSELESLAAECRARGGILSPTGSQSGRPQIDNVCKITAETGRVPSGS